MAKRIIWGAGYVFIHRSIKTRIETNMISKKKSKN